MKKLILQRFRRTDESVRGVLILPNFKVFNTLELPDLNNSRGKSCIPAGVYKLDFNENETPLTKKYRSRFGFFDYHIQIKDVPNRDYIYIHVGNYPKDINGCIAIGLEGGNNSVYKSSMAYALFYDWFKRNNYKYLLIEEFYF